MNLKKLRKKAGITQTLLAKKAGVTRQQISNIENNKNSCSLAVAVKIAAALNLKIDALI